MGWGGGEDRWEMGREHLRRGGGGLEEETEQSKDDVKNRQYRPESVYKNYPIIHLTSEHCFHENDFFRCKKPSYMQLLHIIHSFLETSLRYHK